MTHAITLLFEDGRSATITARADETIVAAAMRERIRLETDCLEGACATCKARCTAGRFTLDDPSAEALSASEAALGYTLCCQMRASSDCTIELPYPSSQALARRPSVEVTARVAAVQAVSSTVVRLELERAGATPFAYLPGQYVHLGVPGTTIRRSYSMANAPGDTSALTFYVKLLAAGAMSDYARGRARPGDPISLAGPFGHFYLRPAVRPVLMVAGGSGLAPMLAMLGALERGGGTTHPIHLLYGVNRVDELFATAELDRLAGHLPLAVERVAFETDGHVTDRLRPALVADGDCDAYLCGPPSMVDAASRWLARERVAPARIHSERFIAS